MANINIVIKPKTRIINCLRYRNKKDLNWVNEIKIKFKPKIANPWIEFVANKLIRAHKKRETWKKFNFTTLWTNKKPWTLIAMPRNELRKLNMIHLFIYFLI